LLGTNGFFQSGLSLSPSRLSLSPSGLSLSPSGLSPSPFGLSLSKPWPPCAVYTAAKSDCVIGAKPDTAGPSPR